MDHSSVDKGTDREQRPYEQAERHEERGYSTKESVCQGSQHKEPPSVLSRCEGIYSLMLRVLTSPNIKHYVSNRKNLISLAFSAFAALRLGK